MSLSYTKKDIPEISEKFNKNIKRLVKILDSNIVNNIPFDTLKRRISIGMKETPIILLQKGGEFIFQYRLFIGDDNLNELFSKELSYFGNTEDLGNDANEKEIGELFNITKNIWIKFNDDEKKYTTKNFKALLSGYSKYKSIV